MRNLTQVDVKPILKRIEDRNNITASYLKIYTEVIKVLTKFEGKKMNKRIETALRNEPSLKGYIIQFMIHAGMYHINFWGNEIPYENRNHFFLGYTTGDGESSDGLVHMDYILEQNKGFTMINIIDPSTVPARVQIFNKIVGDLEKFEKDNDDIWYMLTKGSI